MQTLEQIIKLSSLEDHTSEITLEKVIQAKEIIRIVPTNNKELWEVLIAMNLINAALKRKEFKSKKKDALIHYGILKPRVSRLFHNLIENRQKFDIDFYIDSTKKEVCAYIEINGLQFSFHNIIIDQPLKVFIDSPLNIPKPWKEIKLQKIAGELFDFVCNTKTESVVYAITIEGK